MSDSNEVSLFFTPHNGEIQFIESLWSEKYKNEFFITQVIFENFSPATVPLEANKIVEKEGKIMWH